jgi:hypothetical protein
MSKIGKSDGVQIQVTAQVGGVTQDVPFFSGRGWLIPLRDAAAGVTVDCYARGSYSLPVASGQTFTPNDSVWYDTVADECVDADNGTEAIGSYGGADDQDSTRIVVNLFGPSRSLADEGVLMTPVADTVALAALDVGGVLAAGVSCLVASRGDGYAWRYRYVVGAVPAIDYGTLGYVHVYVAGTHGYWTPEDLSAYTDIINAGIAQRVGALGGGMLGTASSWRLSDEANSPTGHGFRLDHDGAHPNDIVVADAQKAAGTSIELTLGILNLAIVQQATGLNMCASVAYDEIAGAYRIVFPAGVATGALAITAPTTASDIGVAAKLSLATGTGSPFLRTGRANMPTMGAVGGVGEIVYTASADKELAKSGITKAAIEGLIAAVVMPAGPLSDGGTDAIAVAIDVKNLLGDNVAAPKFCHVWTSIAVLGAVAAQITSLTVNDGVELTQDIAADGKGLYLTDATGNLNVTANYAGGARDTYLNVDCGGHVDSVLLQFS